MAERRITGPVNDPGRPAAAGGKVTPFSVTHTSDTALATRASGGTQIGSNITATIPTTGVIRMTVLEAEFDETGAASTGRVAFALDVAGTKVWATADNDAGTSLDGTVDVNTGVASRLVGSGMVIAGGGPSGEPLGIILSFDIVANSFPTGSQTVQVYFGDEASGSTGAVTLTGTTVTCRVLIEVIDTT